MGRAYLKVFFDFEDKAGELSDEEKGRLLLAMLRYAQTGKKPALDGSERFLFPAFRNEIDREIASYNTKVRNGSLGGRPAGGSREPAEPPDGSEGGAVPAEPEETGENRREPEENKNMNKNMNRNTNRRKNMKNEDGKDGKDGKNGKNGEGDGSAPPAVPFGFEHFWAAYPRRQDRQGALRAFAKISPDRELLDRMLEAVALWKGSGQWIKDGGQFIPMPATWLNGRRWEDEIPQNQGAPGAAKPAVNPWLDELRQEGLA